MGALALLPDEGFAPRDMFVTPQLFERRAELLQPAKLIFPRHQLTLGRPEDFAALVPLRERDFEAWLDALALGDERAVAWVHHYTRRRRGASFSPITNTYNSGSGNETIPTGAVSGAITLDGAGGGGARSTSLSAYDAFGGGGGSRVIITRAVLSGEWATNLSYQIGAGGSIGAIGGNPTAGGASFVNGTMNGGVIAPSAGGGRSIFGTNHGIASGGDTNTNGSTGAAGNGTSDNGAGGASATGALGGDSFTGRQAGGGGGFAAGASGVGGAGRGVFAWT